ncbi:hypothetical protein LXL04_003893 [Taraxacum kok-saghyz]
MKVRRGKRSEAFWPSIVMKKWLNIPPKNNDFSEDEIDPETESEEDVCSSSVKEEPMNFKEEHACKMSPFSSQTSNATPSKRLVKHKRWNSESVHSTKTKDVRITIGTWNVAGRPPYDGLDIDNWLCLHEPADIYVLGFQEVVPLNVGNVLGAETREPTSKWDTIIRKSLNKSHKPESIPKSYSAPTSPGTDSMNNDESFSTEITSPDRKEITMMIKSPRFYGLDWSTYELNVKKDICISGKKLRKVLSSSDRVRNDWVTNPIGRSSLGGSRRARHSSGELGLPWIEQQERADFVESLYDVSEQVFEEVDDTLMDTIEVKHENVSTKSGRKFRRYVRIMSKQMVGIYVSVWVRKRLRRHANNVKVSPIGIGLMGYMGNKGSISVSMSLYQTRVCFVCSHLTSGHKDGDDERRNSDVIEILRRTRFFSELDPHDQYQTIPSHDQIFWFGDLNYRINMTDADVREFVSLKRWEKLLCHDELCKVLKNGCIFRGWKEGVINFPPTYKYEFNSARYVGENPKEEKRRTPAWCDRILWFGKGIKQLCYRCSDSRMSDHRPVSSVFSVEVEIFDPRKHLPTLSFTKAAVHPDIIMDNKHELQV